MNTVFTTCIPHATYVFLRDIYRGYTTILRNNGRTPILNDTGKIYPWLNRHDFAGHVVKEHLRERKCTILFQMSSTFDFKGPFDNKPSKRNDYALTWACIIWTNDDPVFCRPQASMSYVVTWWRHQMETFSLLLALVRGIHRSPVTKASDAELWCFLWSAPWLMVE